jgi:septal ring factor EnvC (AmiA/AmiB activator)
MTDWNEELAKQRESIKDSKTRLEGVNTALYAIDQEKNEMERAIYQQERVEEAILKKIEEVAG